MKSVSFFPDHKLIKNPLCWHQTVWHKLKLIHNWVCIDFYPAFAGYIRAWLVSFCSGVYSKMQPMLQAHCAPCIAIACSNNNRLWRTISLPSTHQCADAEGCILGHLFPLTEACFLNIRIAFCNSMLNGIRFFFLLQVQESFSSKYTATKTFYALYFQKFDIYKGTQVSILKGDCTSIFLYVNQSCCLVSWRE